MPGAYAHITLVNLAREPVRLEAGPGMPDAAALALSRWFKFCELGAVSPDYPYLALSSSANTWADLMHYDATGAIVQVGTEIVRGLSGSEQEKALAWLLGYAAHVITDATIHPVVELKVGPYAQNKQHHRICEMNQDAYIFQRLSLGAVGHSEHLSSGIATCGPAKGELDSVVASTWSRMLQTCYSREFGTNPPDIAAWHRGFETMVNKIAEEGNHLMPIARHVAVDCGLTYPAADQIERGEYIDALATPHGVLPYDQVFDKALTHVIEGWYLIGEAVYERSGQYQMAFGNWNLDTGRDEAGQIVLWA